MVVPPKQDGYIMRRNGVFAKGERLESKRIRVKSEGKFALELIHFSKNLGAGEGHFDTLEFRYNRKSNLFNHEGLVGIETITCLGIGGFHVRFFL
jgi:hypothetical protein